MQKIDLEKKRKWYKWVIITLWSLIALGTLSIALLFSSLDRNELPSFTELENPKYDLATLIYDVNGEVFGKYYIENRENISFDEISPNVINALISTEDDRYYSHSGVDVQALFRVAIKSILLQDQSSGGGSTITQQLAKLLFDRPSTRGMSKLQRMKTILQTKMKEWVTAVKLEKRYTKEEIISMYLNKFEFINGAHGIAAAAEIYFNKNQKDLNQEEAALLVGMLQNPSYFNPVRFPDRSKVRRNVVLNEMEKSDLISSTTADSLKMLELDMSDFKRKDQSDGPAPYFRSELTKWLQALLDDQRYYKPDGTKYNIYTDGLKVHTTIDLGYQKHAEAAVFNHMKDNQKRYWRAWRGMDPFIFEADDYQKQIRRESIVRRVRYSDRYISLFENHFADLQSKISEKYDGATLDEPVLWNLLSNKRNPLDVNSLNNESKRDFYKKIKNSDDWKEVQVVWNSFVDRQSEVFKTPVMMTIFDYEAENNEVEKEMSPLDSVIYLARHMQSGLVAADPISGHIKAWVGGVNHRYFKFDHVNSRRQVGSTIKPFVYATAISVQGLSPCEEYDDIQYTITPGDANFNVDKAWSPSNANGLFTGNKYNLYQGLLYSKNSITVRLVRDMGTVEVIRELLDNAGISKEETLPDGRLLIPRLPSICLGSVDLSVREMTGAYTTFANNGIYTEPVFVSHIEDKTGKIIYTSSPHRKQALNPTYNAVMVDMLKNNTGGAHGLGIKSENGGKTGTTNEYADAWFMGITPSLVTGIWVGGDEKWVRFFTLDDGQGFVMARPIFQDFMKRIEADTSLTYRTDLRFQSPPNDFYDLIDCDRYKQGEAEDERASTLEENATHDEFDEEEFDEEDSDEQELEDDDFDEDQYLL